MSCERAVSALWRCVGSQRLETVTLPIDKAVVRLKLGRCAILKLPASVLRVAS